MRGWGRFRLDITSVRYPFCKMAHYPTGSDKEEHENNKED